MIASMDKECMNFQTEIALRGYFSTIMQMGMVDSSKKME